MAAPADGFCPRRRPRRLGEQTPPPSPRRPGHVLGDPGRDGAAPPARLGRGSPPCPSPPGLGLGADRLLAGSARVPARGRRTPCPDPGASRRALAPFRRRRGRLCVGRPRFPAIGSAAGRARGCPDVLISVVAGSLKTITTKQKQ